MSRLRDASGEGGGLSDGVSCEGGALPDGVSCERSALPDGVSCERSALPDGSSCEGSGLPDGSSCEGSTWSDRLTCAKESSCEHFVEGLAEGIVLVYCYRFAEQKHSPRKVSALAHRLLRRVTAGLTGLSEEELTEARTAGGKPFFDRHPEIFYSISHSGTYILLAIAKEPIGVDIQEKRCKTAERPSVFAGADGVETWPAAQKIRPKVRTCVDGENSQEKRPDTVERLARRVLTEEERMEMLAEKKPEDYFFRHFALREAYGKYTGEGLFSGLGRPVGSGWHTFLEIDPAYATALFAGRPLEVVMIPLELPAC